MMKRKGEEMRWDSNWKSNQIKQGRIYDYGFARKLLMELRLFFISNNPRILIRNLKVFAVYKALTLTL